jgi:hypothetical protein
MIFPNAQAEIAKPPCDGWWFELSGHVHGLVGEVNHRRSHCRLAKFRGLMYRGEYSAVIGLKEPMAWKVILGTY